MHHLYLTSRAMIRFVCSHCLGIRRLRVGPDYQRFNTRFSSSAGQCDALSNGNRREICKGSGTDNYYSAQISGKPLQDSSQIFPRMEKHASCSERFHLISKFWSIFLETRAVLLQYCVDCLSKLDLDPCTIPDPRFSKTLRIESRGEFVDVRGRLRNFVGF